MSHGRERKTGAHGDGGKQLLQRSRTVAGKRTRTAGLPLGRSQDAAREEGGPRDGEPSPPRGEALQATPASGWFLGSFMPPVAELWPDENGAGMQGEGVGATERDHVHEIAPKGFGGSGGAVGAGTQAQIQKKPGEGETLSEPDPAVHDHAGRLRQLADPHDPSNPNNRLGPHDMYAAWLDLWTSRDEEARPRRQELEDRLRAVNPADYADKMDMFRAGRRDALGPEYEAAANEADLCSAQLSVMNDVLEWLEARKAMGEPVTLDRVNRRALETARAKAMYVNLFMTVLLVGSPAAAARTGCVPATTGHAAKAAAAESTASAKSAAGESAATAGGTGFRTSALTTNARGQLTNGRYTIDAAGMSPHKTGSLRGGKSQFLSGVDAEKAVLDAAAFADEAGLWVGNKAKVFVENGPVGALGKTGELTNWINVYRTKTGFVHGAPGRAP